MSMSMSGNGKEEPQTSSWLPSCFSSASSAPAPVVDFSKAASFQRPVDADGFYRGFSINNEAEVAQIKPFFDEWGFVVVHDVLTHDDCEQTIDEFWNGAAAEVPGTSRNDPNSWDAFWKRQKFGKLGIIGSFESIEPQLLRNRQNPNVYRVYSLLHGTDRLLVDHDRVGVLRPTRNVPFPKNNNADGAAAAALELVDKPEWKTVDRWLHVDCNPHFGRLDIASMRMNPLHPVWSDDATMHCPIDFYNTLYVQGLVALCDAREQDGGFQCVPGSHVSGLHRELGPRGMGGNIQVPQDHPIREYIQRIPLRQGSMVIWNSLIFHANYPNDSDRFRMVQYMRMLPVEYPFTSLMDAYADALPPGFECSDLGRKLFGYEPWP